MHPSTMCEPEGRKTRPPKVTLVLSARNKTTPGENGVTHGTQGFAKPLRNPTGGVNQLRAPKELPQWTTLIIKHHAVPNTLPRAGTVRHCNDRGAGRFARPRTPNRQVEEVTLWVGAQPEIVVGHGGMQGRSIRPRSHMP